jgi:hypothetical protein
MEPNGSLLLSQEPATGLQSKPDEFSPHPHYIISLSSILT